jgi:hypothetical protein
MKLTHNIIGLAAAALLGSLLAPSAFAAACVAGTEGDFTYRGDTASQCEAQTGNESDPLAAFGSDWDLFAKFDGDQDTAVNTIFAGETLEFGTGTITFSLKYLGLLADGYYHYELIASADPTSLLPASMDLVGSVKQANGYQAYLFESVLVDSSGNLGTFKSLFGPNANGDFSHFSIYGGNYKVANGNGNGNDVPEPATLALLGLGLLGAGALRRRRAS